MELYRSIRNELLDIRMKTRCQMVNELKKHQVECSPVEHKAMVKILSAGVTSQQTLAEAMKRDKAQIARVVARLDKQGMIHKQEDPDDKRCVKLAMTEKGVKILNRMDELDIEIIKEMLSDFTQEESDIFNRLLTKANLNLV